MLHEYLKKLDAVIDPDHVERSEKRIRDAASCKPVDHLPLRVVYPADDWPVFTYREGFYDQGKMLLNELNRVWVSAHVADDCVYTIRANYGVGVIASMFGCETRLTGDDAMPWTEHLSDKELDAVLEADTFDLNAGLGGRVFETERFFLDTLSQHPNLAGTVRIFASDTQGPMDIAHLMMGHRIYTEIYDNPDRVHALLRLAARVYVAFTRAQQEHIGGATPEGFHYHSQMLTPGGGRLCDDSATNFSAASYREFCKPYNQQALFELGGGWVHYCGRGHQMLADLLDTPGVRGLNFGNPEMQDIADVYAKASERNVAILGWNDLDALPPAATTGMVLATGVDTLEDARRLVASFGA